MSKQRILAVDDERAILRLLQVNLERAGYDVDTAENGAEALDRIRASRPDLVVSDVMMPVMDGFALLKALKADPVLADLPVIMLTAKAQDADIFKGWSSGVHGYLTKPFNPAEMVFYIRRAMEVAGEGEDGRIRI